MTLFRRCASVALAAAIVLGAAGCVQRGASGSRAEVFESLPALLSASSAVATVEVMDQQKTVEEGIPLIVSTVRPIETFTPERLAAGLDAGPSTLGAEVVVRQVEVSLDDAPFPALEAGKRYLVSGEPCVRPCARLPCIPAGGYH